MRFFRIPVILLSFFSLAHATGNAAADVTGVSVTVERLRGDEVGKVMRYDIQNGSVSGGMELRSGIVAHAVISPDGRKAAFVEGDSFWGPSKIAVMVVDVDGGEATEVASNICTDWGMDKVVLNMGGWMDFANDNWIYYVRGMHEGSACTDEIWKVNAVTKESRLAYKFSNAGIGIGSFTNDASKMWIRTLEWFHDGTYNQNIFGMLSPAEGSTITIAANDYALRGSGCGNAVSPNGDYVLTTGSLSHDKFSVRQWDGANVKSFSLDDVAQWNGFVGTGTTTINKWSVNSDKWVCMGVGWTGRDHSGGSNQILVNWQDETTINVTGNPQGDATAGPGDFWVGDPSPATGAKPSVRAGTGASHGYGMTTGMNIRPRNCMAWDTRGRKTRIVHGTDAHPGIYIVKR